MTEQQWNLLLDIINGKELDTLPVGFIIDSPWLPGWAGTTTLDYYVDGQKWLDANLKAIRTFPEVIFLPGFWSEFGMCTEPSAFGSKCTWHENDLPFAKKIIHDISDIQTLTKPDPRSDGLLPFMVRRLVNYRDRIEQEGHYLKFAVSRGPLNIASFLMGTTELMMAIKTDPEPSHRLIDLITEFTIDWIGHQIEQIPTIDGILMLDDIVGFIGDEDFRQFALPYIKRIYDAFDVAVKFFHNDADGRVCASYLDEIGINLFNFSHNHSLGEMRSWAGEGVALLGNIPPRDVLAQGSVNEVQKCVQETLAGMTDTRRVLVSCGGGMPPDVSTENINAFLESTQSCAGC